VTAAQPSATVAPDGVDLVDEDDRRRDGLRLVEEVPNARGADAHEHLDEVRAGDGEEGGTRFACDSSREERLACAGRPGQQHALRDAGAESAELRGLGQKLLDLLELLHRLVGAGDVLEAHLGRVRGHPLGAALAEAEGTLSGPALRAAEQEEEEHDDDEQREEECEQLPEDRRARPL
jgi:hypothetical protein